jgi:hypothetical protein
MFITYLVSPYTPQGDTPYTVDLAIPDLILVVQVWLVIITS